MSIVERYELILERIATAANRAGRQPGDVNLVAVTKTWPAEIVVTAYQAGMSKFGENRAEEMTRKRPEVEAVLGTNSGIVWHAIGALQSRKSNMVADNADVFHALDRLKVAKRLSKRLIENGRSDLQPLSIFLEVNISGESAKAGIDCSRWEDDPGQRRNLADLALAVVELPGFRAQGLMTMAPWQVEPEVIRTIFRRTRRLGEWLQQAAPDADWSGLSMGMTDDFEMAIDEGATHIRVGRALFGHRG